MPDFTFPLDAYLNRISWNGPVEPTSATLAVLHRQQVQTIPFENLDPFTGRPISLEPADLVEKLILRGRGGYCFELNGLFLLALQALGFRTRSLCARVQISAGNYGPRSHQTTLVEFEGDLWLADVGFGGNGLIEAIPFELDREFDQGLDRFHFVQDETYGFRLEHRLPDDWRTLYAFSLDPYLFSDFRALNYFICRSPDSVFTRTPICIRTMATERRILVANQYKVRTADGRVTATTLETPDEFRSVITGPFGIPLAADHELPAPPPPLAGMREI